MSDDWYREHDEDWYILICRICSTDPVHPQVMPFSSAAERGRWAAAHTRATGHDKWFVRDFLGLNTALD